MRRAGIAALLLSSIGLLVWVATLGPIPQPLDYHRYADSRAIAGIPCFWNVVSNLPFGVIGAAGIWWLSRPGRRGLFIDPAERLAYMVFFAGEFLTCFGSAYYHAAPDNATLVWDRLVFSLMLTSFFTIVVSEFVSARAGRRMLVPMALLGVASVLYWAWTESTGCGDLRPYAVIQFFPVVIMPAMFLTSRGRYSGSRILSGAWLLYVIAKVCELRDHEIFALTGFLSGHTFKHVIAALASCVPLYAVARRKAGFGPAGAR